MRKLVLTALLIAVWIAQVTAVLAQAAAPAADQASTIVTGAGLWTAIGAFVLAAVGAVFTFIVNTGMRAFSAWTKIQIEAKYQDYLHRAADTAATVIAADIGKIVEPLSIDVRSAAVARIVQWIERSVPDAVRALGATPEKLGPIAERWLEAHIAVQRTVQAAATTAAAPPASVVVLNNTGADVTKEEPPPMR